MTKWLLEGQEVHRAHDTWSSSTPPSKPSSASWQCQIFPMTAQRWERANCTREMPWSVPFSKSSYKLCLNAADISVSSTGVNVHGVLHSRNSQCVHKCNSNLQIFRSRNSRSFHGHHLLFHGLFTIFHGSSVHCQMQLQQDPIAAMWNCTLCLEFHQSSLANLSVVCKAF